MKRTAIGDGLYRDAGGGWWMRPTVSGRRTWRKLASLSIDEARVEAAAVIADHRRSQLGLAQDPFSTPPVKTFRELAESYVAAGCPDRGGRSRSPVAEARERRNIARLVPVLGGLPPMGVNHYQARLYGQTRGDAPRAADVELATASNVLNWAVQSGIITANPLRGRVRVQRPETVRHARDCMPASGDEVHALAKTLLAVQASQSVGWQLILQAFTGCRTQELLALRMNPEPKGPGWVEGRWLYIRRAKRGLYPYVEIHPALARAIEAHHAWHRDRFADSDFWFPGQSGILPLGRVALTMALDRICPKLGMRKITAHGLRAFYVTVHRSLGESDEQVAARIGDATASLISSTYGNLPEVWSGGDPLDWMPKSGIPAWVRPGEDPKSSHILPFPGSGMVEANAL